MVDKKVIIYTTPTCPFCIMAKKFLEDNNIDFEDFNVSTDRSKAEEMIKKTGQMVVPVIEIEGTIIVGFDREKIRNALGI